MRTRISARPRISARWAIMTGAAIAFAACGPDTQTGQCKDPLLAGDLVITEVFADSKAPPGGSGTDEGKEWFEIYNASDETVELQGLTVTHARPDGSRAKTHVMKSIVIAAGQYLTLGNSADDLLPPYVDYGYSADLGDFFNTDGGKLSLACGSSEVDSAVYDTVKEGHSRQLTASQPPDYTLNDDTLNWCQANDAEFETANFGTPGSDSDCTPIVIGQCSDGSGMRDTVPPGVGDLVITELMPKPRTLSATTAQWFEVYATKDLDLNGVGLDRANDSSAATTLSSPDCIHMTAGSYAVFARSADMGANGGLTTRGTFSFSINPAMNPDLQLVYNGAVIDSITWTTSTTGESLSLDPDFTSATGNDVASNFCGGTAQYDPSPNLGSPGTANPQCAALPVPGMCNVGGVPRAIVKPAAGALVITEFLANPATTPIPDGTTDATKEWFEIKNTSGAAFDLNELGLRHNGTGATTPELIQSTDCISVAPGALAVIARSSTMANNAGLMQVDATFGFSLTDSGTNSTGIQVLDGTTLLDAISWTSVTSGRSLQLDPDQQTAAANDTAAVAAGLYCLATTTYGDNSNQGTPRVANPQCP